MKHYIINIVSALAVMAVVSSCYKEAPCPETINHAVEINANTTVAQLKAMYKEGGNEIFQNIIVKAQVASDDKEGNLYKTMSIEDSTGGIEVKAGMGNLNLLYKQGSTVYVKCQGLKLGKYAGNVTLGYKSADEKYETGFIPDLMIPKVIVSGPNGTITPHELTIPQLTSRYANTLVKIKNVQFVENELGMTWADAQNKQKVNAVNRTLIDREGNTVIVRTSSYAKFASRKLPEGNGDAVALLTFFNGTPQLVVMTPSDFHFDGKRFDR